MREQVKIDVVKSNQEQKAKQEAENLLSALKNGDKGDGENQDPAPEFKTTDFFKRSGSIPNLGFEPEISASAFSLTANKALPDTPVKGAKGYYVIRFKAEKLADEEAFAKEKEKLRENLLQQKQLKTFEEWLASVRAQSEITYAEGFLNET